VRKLAWLAALYALLVAGELWLYLANHCVYLGYYGNGGCYAPLSWQAFLFVYIWIGALGLILLSRYMKLRKR